MQNVNVLRISVLLLVCSRFLINVSAEATLSIPFFHKFSDKAKERFAQRGEDWPFPEQHTLDYHKFLVHHDAARHGRMLATAQEGYTFLEGNFTLQLFGGLFYATIHVGTPAVPFLVALDTGSDLFWLPCECTSCAPQTSPIYQDYGIINPLNVYDPTISSTSKTISCNSDDCHLYINQCPTNGAECQYKANYASVNTSTSGRLVEDVIHLIPNSGSQKAATVPIIVGCGQIQTGAFLDGFGAPGGLIGLGLQDYSVPASLAKSGLVEDSFSMCFDIDGSGRVVFGDKGSSTQKVTLFEPAALGQYETYFVGMESISCGNDSLAVNEPALFDTGTTYTYLNSKYYQALLTSFASQVEKYERIPVGSEAIAPWELCYLTSDDRVDVPAIDFVLTGGKEFSIRHPFVLLIYSNNSVAGFCLALFESNANIIGANFMTGNNLVFNRAEKTLGFEEADCYDVTVNGVSPVPEAGGPTPATKAPVPAPAPAGKRLTPTSPGPESALSPPPSAASSVSMSLVTLLSLGLVHFLFQ